MSADYLNTNMAVRIPSFPNPLPPATNKLIDLPLPDQYSSRKSFDLLENDQNPPSPLRKLVKQGFIYLNAYLQQ